RRRRPHHRLHPRRLRAGARRRRCPRGGRARPGGHPAAGPDAAAATRATESGTGIPGQRSEPRLTFMYGRPLAPPATAGGPRAPRRGGARQLPHPPQPAGRTRNRLGFTLSTEVTMDIAVVARNTEVAERFRTHLEDKLSKVEQLAPRAHRIEVEITREQNPRLADQAERVELTVIDRGPTVRAEAAADDRYAALDMATTKLMERLRR